MSASILHHNKSRIGIAVAILALAGLLVTLVASRSDATSVPPKSDTFSVLEPASAAAITELPSGAQEWLGTLPEVGGSPGAPSEAGVATTSTGEAVVVAGEGESVCFHAVQSGLSNCAPAGLVSTGSVYTTAPDLAASPNGCAGWQVVGVMPDGVTSLQVNAPGAPSDPTSIPVTANVYAATLAPVHTTLSSEGISVELPLDKFASGQTAC